MRRRVSKPASFTTALRRLGLALPPPFVGRHAEVAALAAHLGDAAFVVVVGPVGAGKTRLAQELCSRADLTGPLRGVYLRACPGDRPEALRARAERLLGAAPGGLDDLLREEARLLVVDDTHNIAGGGVVAAFGELARRPGAGRVLLLGRETPALPRSAPVPAELTLDGLDAASARELWAHLEETYGPTPAVACDQALCRTRGLPLALRREYAIAAGGAHAWDVDRLAPDARAALEVIAVAMVPVAPAAVSALAPAVDVEQALIELVTRQLIDPLEDGRFAMHDDVRDEVRGRMSAAARAALDHGFASLLGRGVADQGALGVLDPIDRLRLAVHHLIAAGDDDAAETALAAGAAGAIARAAGGEILGLIDLVRGARPAATPALAHLAATIAVRRGEVAAALEGGGPTDPVLCAELRLRGGEVATAAAQLETLCADGADADQRGRGGAVLAEIALERGQPAEARRLVEDALGLGLGSPARARVLLALARIEMAEGSCSSARASLARARSAAGADAALAARIEIRRSACLLAEGRIREALAVLVDAEQAAGDADCADAVDEARAVRAQGLAARGELSSASRLWSDLVTARHARGDELNALRGELEWAAVLERRGELIAAAEQASAAGAAAARMGLTVLAQRAGRISSAVDAAAWRCPPPPAGEDCDTRTRVAALAARGENRAALELARILVATAERMAHAADLADGLAWCARLELAGGDRRAAELTAARAAREAAGCGASWARATALLVLAAVTREEGDVVSASSYARDAAAMATIAGLPVERLVADRALSAIADGGARELPGAGATLSDAARAAASRAMADLGLCAVRPFRVIAADGQESRVADASPERLRVADRDLVVDGVREAIMRGGTSVADLRRRSLLKRLLFLFAAAPGKIFSKEEIVQTVWSVEYHPLRHDAALFTNIMRIRRLLGADGADLIRVSEDGYRFTPGADFLFFEPVS